MTTPIIRLTALVKSYTALRPLRIAGFSVAPTDRVVLSGLDQGAAEMFVYLVTGAALPDEGAVEIEGRNTREIATDTEWLSSLDRFGIVTNRAILLDTMSVAANLALPLTLSIDPMSAETLARASKDAADVGLESARLHGPMNALSEVERLRVHLARAAAGGPRVVMLEHPTAALDQAAESARFGETLRAFSDARAFGWVAISEDRAFAEASGGTQLRLDAASGEVKPARGGWFKRLRGL